MVTARIRLGVVGALLCLVVPARGADLVALSAQAWDRYAPEGKEADAIYGDFALANDRIVAVVAHPRRGRNANMTVREVGGCLIDLTTREGSNDQLSAYYPGAGQRELRFAGVDVEAPTTYEAESIERVFARAKRVTLRLVAVPREGQPDVTVAYSLEDGSPFVLVTTTFTNRGRGAVDADLVDSMRADRTFDAGPQGDESAELFWVYDKAFGQAYGVVAEGHTVMGADARRPVIRYRNADGKAAVRLEPGASYRLARRIFPGSNLFDVRGTAAVVAGKAARSIEVRVRDKAGRPIRGAEVSLVFGGKPQAWRRTDAEGLVRVSAGAEAGSLKVSAAAHGESSRDLTASEAGPIAVELPEAGYAAVKVTDERGGPIACKVQFAGRDGTTDPDFGPDTGEHAVRNLYYSHDGAFRQALAPGTYDVIISHGPEYDAVFAKIVVGRGKDAAVEGKLVRSVKTDGWISTDYHSHSSPSGDNTASQLGRVLNLLCEHVEFAPCTEHNRLSTYDPHLEALGATRRMATCVGIELTGKPLPLNHQNAFPLVMRPRTQDGGGPTADDDPATQIERLAMWDAGSEKLVQVNHPDMGRLFRDRDGDGKADSGFAGMVPHMDVIEVHPLHTILGATTSTTNGKTYNNTIVNWLQLLNQGRRIPGVVNTDAHANFHGSGWLRNYVKSPTDDPAEIRTADVVRASERGRLVMSSGPFMEVSLKAEGSGAEAGPGEDLAASGGRATLKVKVQCPNWFDVDRVQVFVNGRAAEALNFTRKSTPERFSGETVKFDQAIPMELKGDAHVVVAAIGEGSGLGIVMGPDHKDDRPVAVSNPIFVDVDGGGFKANGDELGGLPVKGGL